MNLRLVLEYDGTDFCGWQVQPGKRTVQGVLEGALTSLLGATVRVHGSGRTDAGVHAVGQVASVHLGATSIPPERFKLALNPLLPADVKVVESGEVPADFHARYSAKGKTYRYCILNRSAPSPLYRHRAWQIKTELDYAKMECALKLFEGTHDFRAFCAAGSSAGTTERTVYQAALGVERELVIVTLHGNGFLYNMVRIIVGAAVAVALEQTTAEKLEEALTSAKRTALVTTAPAHGLYLMSVDY